MRCAFKPIVKFCLELLTSEVLGLVVGDLSQEEELQLQTFPLSMGDRRIDCLYQMVDLLESACPEPASCLAINQQSCHKRIEMRPLVGAVAPNLVHHRHCQCFAEREGLSHVKQVDQQLDQRFYLRGRVLSIVYAEDVVDVGLSHLQNSPRNAQLVTFL